MKASNLGFHHSREKGFTLIELLIVIAIIAILAVIVILVLNPASLLQQSRDANRLSDIQTITSAVNIYTSQGGFVSGTPNITYLSLVDPTATTSAGTNCGGLGSAFTTGFEANLFHCAASSTYNKVNGTGWLPLNFSNLPIQTPVSVLPVDPLNTSSTNCYSYETDGTNWEIGGFPESQKYASQASSSFLSGSTRNFFNNAYCGPITYSSTTYSGILSNAYSIAFDSHTNTMWVANYGGNSVTVFNDTTLASITYPTGANPNAVSFDPHTNTVWVTSVTNNSVTVFNDTTFTSTTYSVGTNPCAIAFDPHTNTMWVGNNNSSNVTVLNDTNYTASSHAAGATPCYFAFDPHTNTMWLANQTSNLWALNDTTYAVTTYSVQGGVAAAAAFDTHTNTVWVWSTSGALTSGVRTFRSPEHIGGVLRPLIKLFTPTVIVIKIADHNDKKYRADMASIVRCVRREAALGSIPVVQVTSKWVRNALGAGARNKEHVAQCVVRAFPSLGWKLPPTRDKPWVSEGWNMAIFDAAAVGIAFIAKSPKDATSG